MVTRIQVKFSLVKIGNQQIRLVAQGFSSLVNNGRHFEIIGRPASFQAGCLVRVRPKIHTRCRVSGGDRFAGARGYGFADNSNTVFANGLGERLSRFGVAALVKNF